MWSPELQWCEAHDLAPRVRGEFRSRHGRAAVAVGRAPGRVNLIGDHTDYLGGLCLPLPLPHATWVAWAPRDDGRLVLSSEGHPEWVAPLGRPASGWATYVASVLQAVGHRGGASVHVGSTVPVGAGLASSAALLCATAVAVSDAAAEDLLVPCIRAEQEGVGAPTGGLDQTVALLGVAGHALLLDFASGDRSTVAWLPGRAGVELLVIDTGTRHAHAAGGYGDRRREGERAMQAGSADDPVLRRRRRHVLSENERVARVAEAVGREDWHEVGRLFTASHGSLRDDYEVSCPELDATVEASLTAGALGARMTGGGFGGCALVLVERQHREAVLAEVASSFRRRGWASPRVLPTTGGHPAARV